MPKFPIDAPKARVIKALELLGFHPIREREHIAMVRENADGTRTPLTMPNHARIKGSTLEKTEAGAIALEVAIGTALVSTLER